MGKHNRPKGIAMSVPRKKRRKLSTYYRQILKFIPEFEKATGQSGNDLDLVAAWAYLNKKWEPPPRNVIKQLARDLARASAQDYITDDNGEPVRWRHGVKDEKTQKTFWYTMDKATPEQIRMSAQSRRNGALNDILQIDRDLNHFNKNYNPGDPIQMSFNFDPDVEERHLPPEYPDSPPEGQPSE